MKESDFFKDYPVSILRRAYQRSIGVTIKPSGLIRVSAGKLTPRRSIWRYLNEVEGWVEKTQDEYKALREKYPKKEYKEGEIFYFLGRPHTLRFQRDESTSLGQELAVVSDHSRRLHPVRPQPPLLKRSSVIKANSKRPKSFVAGESLVLLNSKDAKKEVRQFYEKEGRHILADRVADYAEEMNLKPKKLSFRAQKTRWGSCGSNGHITLNWKLVVAPLEVVDYVVVHELAHLKYQNHGPKFWQLVEKFSKSYREDKAWLSRHQFEFDFLNKKSELYP